MTGYFNYDDYEDYGYDEYYDPEDFAYEMGYKDALNELQDFAAAPTDIRNARIERAKFGHNASSEYLRNKWGNSMDKLRNWHPTNKKLQRRIERAYKHRLRRLNRADRLGAAQFRIKNYGDRIRSGAAIAKKYAHEYSGKLRNRASAYKSRAYDSIRKSPAMRSIKRGIKDFKKGWAEGIYEGMNTPEWKDLMQMRRHLGKELKAGRFDPAMDSKLGRAILKIKPLRKRYYKNLLKKQRNYANTLLGYEG